MRRIMISLAIIAAVGAIVVKGTTAFFSDTETSTGNTFTAGAIDLKIDSQAHYNGMVCVVGPNGAYTWQFENANKMMPTGGQYPVPGTPCTGTWSEKDLVSDSVKGDVVVGDKFFNYTDIKPGDSGENTISLHVINNDAWLCAEVSGLSNLDNGLTEPEALVDTTADVGELQNAMIMTIWRDDGDNVYEPNGNPANCIDININDDTTGCSSYDQSMCEFFASECTWVPATSGEQLLLSGSPVNGILPIYDASTGPALSGGSTTYLGVSWSLPGATGNEVQTDSLTGDISFNAVQARNNPNFYCNPRPTVAP